MTKTEAAAIAERKKLAIRVHYAAQMRQIREIEAAAFAAVDAWIETKAYRKKDNRYPYVQTFTLHNDYARPIERTLQEAKSGDVERVLIKNLLDGPPRP